MTALCVSGGPSHPKAGAAELVILGAGEIAALLSGSGNVWAMAAAPVLGVLSYDAVNLCATDPPAMPTFAPSDWVDLFFYGNLEAHTAAVVKFGELLANIVWSVLCECVSGAQPPPPPPVAPPFPMPDLGGLTGAIPTANCLTLDSGNQPYTAGPGGTNMIPFYTAQHVGHRDFDLTPGCTGVRLLAYDTPSGTHHGDFLVSLQTSTTLGGSPHNYTLNTPIASGASLDFGFASVHSGDVYADLEVAYGGTQPDDLIRVVLMEYCGGSTPTTVVGNCGPDPSTVALLNQIYGLLQLIQRQAAPFGYVTGASHTGLTTSGELTVADLLGVKITVTTIPGYVGSESGDPDEYFDIGWFAWGSTDGFSAREFITHSPQLSLPADAGLYTRLGYTLHPGVVVTVEELIREP